MDTSTKQERVLFRVHLVSGETLTLTVADDGMITIQRSGAPVADCYFRRHEVQEAVAEFRDLCKRLCPPA